MSVGIRWGITSAIRIRVVIVTRIVTEIVVRVTRAGLVERDARLTRRVADLVVPAADPGGLAVMDPGARRTRPEVKRLRVVRGGPRRVPVSTSRGAV